MANHKRKRPKHQRAGCLMCKPHKDEREAKKDKPSVRRQQQTDEELLAELGITQEDLKESERRLLPHGPDGPMVIDGDSTLWSGLDDDDWAGGAFIQFVQSFMPGRLVIIKPEGKHSQEKVERMREVLLHWANAVEVQS